MPGPTLTVDELAAELGRSTKWVYLEWGRLCGRERMPMPLHNGASPLVWDRAQIMAWKDKPLTLQQRALAAAFRCAAEAAEGQLLTHNGNARVAADKAALDQMFGRVPA